MASDEHLARLREGVQAWNRWREDNPGIRPELTGADGGGVNLSGADLAGADFTRAELAGSDLSKARLFGVDFREANLFGADLTQADLRDCLLYTSPTPRDS